MIKVKNPLLGDGFPVASLSLLTWADQYVRLKARMHGWKVTDTSEGYVLHTPYGETTVFVKEALSSHVPDNSLIITLNTRENEQILLTLLPRLREARFILVNPKTGKFWTVNSRFMHTLADRLPTSLESFRGDVEYVL